EHIVHSVIEPDILGAFVATRRTHAAPKTLADAVKLTGVLGEYLTRNNDGPPKGRIDVLRAHMP
ncbi:MAG: hypothetical protein ACR2RB_19900, partial [Gammaproteobacteria bacterium]